MQTTRKQLSVQLSVLLAAVCAVFLLIGGAAEAEAPPSLTVDYVVSAGDTLWEIAADRVPAGESVRTFVRAIKEASNLEVSSLQPGQVLHIPSP